MIRSNGRTNMGADISRVRAIILFHRIDGRRRDILQRSHPTRVGETYHTLAGIMYQNWNAISEAHEECDIGSIGKNDICLAIGFAGWTRGARTNDIRAVDLP